MRERGARQRHAAGHVSHGAGATRGHASAATAHLDCVDEEAALAQLVQLEVQAEERVDNVERRPLLRLQGSRCGREISAHADTPRAPPHAFLPAASFHEECDG